MKDGDGVPPGRQALAQISTSLVQLYRRYYGRGPIRAKTHVVDDFAICILQGGFTVVEQTMIERGESESVFAIRRTFQDVMEDEFTDVVEQALGRRVIAYMSQVHTDPPLNVEIFALEPEEATPGSAGLTGTALEGRRSAEEGGARSVLTNGYLTPPGDDEKLN